MAVHELWKGVYSSDVVHRGGSHAATDAELEVRGSGSAVERREFGWSAES